MIKKDGNVIKRDRPIRFDDRYEVTVHYYPTIPGMAMKLIAHGRQLLDGSPPTIDIYGEVPPSIPLPLRLHMLEGETRDQVLAASHKLQEECENIMKTWELMYSLVPPGEWKERDYGAGGDHPHMELCLIVEPERINYLLRLTAVKGEEGKIAYLFRVRLGEPCNEDPWEENNYSLMEVQGTLTSGEDMEDIIERTLKGAQEELHNLAALIGRDPE